MNLYDELAYTSSDFLCPKCKEPLYFDLESKKDVCINLKCILHPPTLYFHDINSADFLRKQMKCKESKIKLNIMQLDKSSFIRFLQQQRSVIIKGSPINENDSKKRIIFEQLLLIDEMLILTNSLNIVGRNRNKSSFLRVLNEYKEFFSEETQIEDIENQRSLISLDKKIYMLKYWKIILQIYQNYGIANEIANASQMFKYQEIDDEAKEDVEFRFGMDIAKIFEQDFDKINALKYILEMYYRTSKQHKYDPTGLDIAILLGLFFSAKDSIEYWSRESLQRHYNRTANGKGNFKQFMEEYVLSKEKAPIIVFDSKTYIFDKETLPLYISYLIGRNRRKVEGQTEGGEERIMKKKQEASVIFEKRIRKQLRDCGYIVSNTPLIISEQKEKYEYDVIGIKEDSKEIVLIEVKYKDPSPSSLTGKNIVQQELLDEDGGILIEAIRQQNRLDFFRKYFHRFKSELSFKLLCEDYSISAWIVTKYLPLISKFKEISISSVFDEFCKKFHQA